MKKIAVIESILFAANKSVSHSELAKFLKISEDEVAKSVKQLKERFNVDESGIHLSENNKKLQFVTNPNNAKQLHEYFETELTGELSKPSLETLTIIAYRQPISKEELEQIRGVNCSLILRNLLIRGLVETREEKGDLATMYLVTMDFLRHLGINSVEDLPDYEKLNSNENLQALLESATQEDEKQDQAS